VDPLPDIYAAPAANDRKASEIGAIGPLECAAILFALCSTSFVAWACLARLANAVGGIGGLSASNDAWRPFVANLLPARDNALLILLSLSACAIDTLERWRARFTLLALCVVAVQVGVGILSVVLGLKREWATAAYSAAYSAGSLATVACLVWATVNSLRSRSGIAVGIALLIAMPLLPLDPTGNRTVALCVVAALPNCLHRLTAPIIACGLFALEHLLAPGFTLGIPWTLAAAWLVVRGWRLASSWPVGSGERAALRAGLFLMSVSLLLGQMQFLQQALVPKSRVPGTPFTDMAWLATFHGSAMIVAATLLRDAPSNVTAQRMRVVVAIWLVAALEVVFWQGLGALPTTSLLVAVLAMGVSLAWAVGARLSMNYSPEA